MTERYGMSNETGAFIDNQIHKEYTDDEIIDLLNEQHEQIQLMISECRHIQGQNQRLSNYLRKCGLPNEKIREIANDKKWLGDYE